MKGPNLFIAGAARSGTTSLWQYFKLHPEVYVPENELFKEPSFFSEVGKHMSLRDYLRIFEHVSPHHKWVCEASVAYLTDPQSASRIHQFNPAAKIIIILRNPSDRAASLYNWMVQDGYEYAASFEEALKLEEDRSHQKEADWYRPNYYWGYMYYRSGLYSGQVKPYLQLFGDNVCLIKFEDFIRNPVVMDKRLCRFLGIQSINEPRIPYNPSRPVHSSGIQFIIRKINQYIISQNRSGIEMPLIAGKIRQKYGEFEKRLSRVRPLGLSEKIKGKQILTKIKSYLDQLTDPFPYVNLTSKKQRDHILEYGMKRGKPTRLGEKTRTDLLRKYENEIKQLSDLSGMETSDWLKEK